MSFRSIFEKTGVFFDPSAPELLIYGHLRHSYRFDLSYLSSRSLCDTVPKELYGGFDKDGDFTLMLPCSHTIEESMLSLPSEQTLYQGNLRFSVIVKNHTKSDGIARLAAEFRFFETLSLLLKAQTDTHQSTQNKKSITQRICVYEDALLKAWYTLSPQQNHTESNQGTLGFYIEAKKTGVDVSSFLSLLRAVEDYHAIVYRLRETPSSVWVDDEFEAPFWHYRFLQKHGKKGMIYQSMQTLPVPFGYDYPYIQHTPTFEENAAHLRAFLMQRNVANLRVIADLLTHQNRDDRTPESARLIMICVGLENLAKSFSKPQKGKQLAYKHLGHSYEEAISLFASSDLKSYLASLLPESLSSTSGQLIAPESLGKALSGVRNRIVHPLLNEENEEIHHSSSAIAKDEVHLHKLCQALDLLMCRFVWGKIGIPTHVCIEMQNYWTQILKYSEETHIC